MNFQPKDNTGRLFAAADQLLAMRSSNGAHLPAAAQINALPGGARVGPWGFTRAELLEARALLVRLGFATPADSLT